MNKNLLLKVATKAALGLAASAIIGYTIKAEKSLEEKYLSNDEDKKSTD